MVSITAGINVQSGPIPITLVKLHKAERSDVVLSIKQHLFGLVSFCLFWFDLIQLGLFWLVLVNGRSNYDFFELW